MSHRTSTKYKLLLDIPPGTDVAFFPGEPPANRDRSGWIGGTDPHDPRIHRLAELISSELSGSDLRNISTAALRIFIAAIWRRIEEEEQGDN